jgi:DNA-binding MarR family transcriptional regulator
MSSRSAKRTGLDALDDALSDVRRLWDVPMVRQHVLDVMPEGLDLPTLRTLRAIERGGARPSMSAVARLLAVDPSTASRLVNRAVEEGYAERGPDAEDRRKSIVVLTPAGRHLMGEATKVRRALLGRATAGWDEADVRMLADLLARLSSSFRELAS